MPSITTLSRLLFGFLTLAASLAFGAENIPSVKRGDALPAATVRNDQGAAVTLGTLASRPTVMIFYRGGWCPYCNRHLAALANIEADLLAAGYQLVALSPDRPEKIRAKPEQRKLNYTLLSDSKMEAAQALGIAFKLDDALVEKYKGFGIDLEASSGEKHHLLPHPAVFIVDAKGVIQFAFANTDYQVRLEPEKILAAAREIAAAR